jgi:hypothetical protein
VKENVMVDYVMGATVMKTEARGIQEVVRKILELSDMQVHQA